MVIFWSTGWVKAGCLCGEGEDGSPIEAGTEGCEDDGRCGRARVGGVPFGCGDEEGGGGGVAVTLDVAEEAVFGIGDLKGGGNFADEIYVGLVHEEDADVGGFEIIFCQEVF